MFIEVNIISFGEEKPLTINTDYIQSLSPLGFKHQKIAPEYQIYVDQGIGSSITFINGEHIFAKEAYTSLVAALGG